VTLLEMKRANNIAITLSRFKVSNDEIKKAILTLDTGILDLDQLQMLLTLLPTSDEIKMLKVGCRVV
jgi:dishevelled associated activator of morphogenesis